MSIYEPTTKCSKCGVTVSTYDAYCTCCGAKLHDTVKGARISEEAASKWFSQAGSLDDSLDSSHTPPKPAPIVSEPAPVVKPPVASPTAASAGATFIKPVKGLKDTPATPVRREPESVTPIAAEPISTEPAPVIPVAPIKEEPRCKKCGAVVPKGTTLCWKCSTDKRSGDDATLRKKSSDIRTSFSPGLAKNKKTLFICGAACLTLIILICIIIGAGSSSRKVPDSVIEDTLYSYEQSLLNYSLPDEYDLTADYSWTATHSIDKKAHTDTVFVTMVFTYEYGTMTTETQIKYRYNRQSDIWDAYSLGEWSTAEYSFNSNLLGEWTIEWFGSFYDIGITAIKDKTVEVTYHIQEEVDGFWGSEGYCVIDGSGTYDIEDCYIDIPLEIPDGYSISWTSHSSKADLTVFLDIENGVQTAYIYEDLIKN